MHAIVLLKKLFCKCYFLNSRSAFLCLCPNVPWRRNRKSHSVAAVSLSLSLPPCKANCKRQLPLSTFVPPLGPRNIQTHVYNRKYYFLAGVGHDCRGMLKTVRPNCVSDCEFFFSDAWFYSYLNRNSCWWGDKSGMSGLATGPSNR